MSEVYNGLVKFTLISDEGIISEDFAFYVNGRPRRNIVYNIRRHLYVKQRKIEIFEKGVSKTIVIHPFGYVRLWKKTYTTGGPHIIDQDGHWVMVG